MANLTSFFGNQESSHITLASANHTAVFSPNGLDFQPHTGPTWQWQLQSVTVANQPLASTKDIQPAQQDDRILYDRGSIVEQYLTRPQSIEQQFVIPQKLTMTDEDLVITGSVLSNGRFQETTAGWLWVDEAGVVSLGHVTVFDSKGHIIPAQFTVTANQTEIRVDGRALAAATYPVTIDPEIGTNDFRISEAGTNVDTTIQAYDASVAYNSTNDQFLIVWASDHNANGDTKIFGQIIDAATEAIILDDFAIGTQIGSSRPTIAFNSNDNNYFVVWQDNSNVVGKIVSSAGVTSTATIQINDTLNSAIQPDVVYNSTDADFLVVWQGNDAGDEAEIYGRVLNGADGLPQAGSHTQISFMGPDNDTNYLAQRPAAAYDDSNNQYLVVWRGDDNTAPLINDEYEIFGQILQSNLITTTNKIRISAMGPAGDTNYSAAIPDVAFNNDNDQYLVVWAGEHNSGFQGNGEFEIYGQRLDAAGNPIGSTDFRISDMGDDGNADYDAFAPAVIYDSDNDAYLIVWRGDDNTAPLVDDEYEIFAQWIDGNNGAALGNNDVRLSDMGNVDGDNNYVAQRPSLAYDSGFPQALVVWQGDDNTGPLVDNEFEIFAQRLQYACDTNQTVSLGLSITESIDPVIAGSGAGNLTYTATVTNNGSFWACNVSVDTSLVMPSGVSVDSITPSGATTYADPIWSVGDLASGDSETLTFVLTAASNAPAGTDSISLQGVATAINDPSATVGVDDITVATSISREVDLQVTVTESADPVAAGSGSGNLTYTVIFTNTGPSDASDVALDLVQILPGGVTIDSITPSSGSFINPTWTIPSLPTSVSETLTIVLTVSAATSAGTDVISTTATITNANETIINTGDDLDSEATSVTDNFFFIQDVTTNEGNSGTTNYSFVISRTNTTDPSSVVVQSADNTAVAGSDYTALPPTTINFAANGPVTQTIIVAVSGDGTVELDESFFLNLSNPTNGVILDSQAIGTIVNDDSAAITIADVSQNEGDLGSNSFVFAVTLAEAVDTAVSVDFTTVDDTATVSDNDYASSSNTLLFSGSAGETQLVTIDVNGDVHVEANEQFEVVLSGLAAAGRDVTIADNIGVGTILNDDSTELGFLATMTAVSEADGSAMIEVILSNPSAFPISVNYATSDNTATAGSDYVATSGTLNFALGETSQSFAVTINEDSSDEADETVTLTLSNPSGAAIGANNPATLVIMDNDGPSIINFSSFNYAVSEGAGTAVVTATLSNPSSQVITAEVATSDGTAVAGSDYTAFNQTITFAPNSSQTSFTINISADNLYELDETLTISLSNPTNATIGLVNTATLTIQDDDPPPTLSLSVANPAISESAGTVAIDVNLNVASGLTTTVTMASSNGTALAGTDYTAVNSPLTIPPGQVSATVNLAITPDLLDEPDETLFITLSNASNGVISPLNNPMTLYILDDDGVPTINFISTAISAGEGSGNVTVTVRLSNPSSSVVQVDYSSADGTAQAGADYTAVNDTLIFNIGDTEETFNIPINDDALYETDETLTVSLSNPQNGDLGLLNPIELTIQDNDNPPSVQFSSSNFTVDELDGTATITVVLSAVSGIDTLINYASIDGTAVAGSDYTAVAGSLNILAGATSGTITIPILSDLIQEGDETVQLTLSTPTNAILGNPANATLTIQDSFTPISVYFPMVMNDFTGLPDLVVSAINFNGSEIEIELTNVGNTAVVDSFWVDAYFNPNPPPTGPNQTIETLNVDGLVWGITTPALPLGRGDSISLRLNDAYYRSDLSRFDGNIPAGAEIYVQVDSANQNTTYGAILEIHEANGEAYNNISHVTAP